MSWLQLHGETWPTTDDEADVRFRLRAADTGLPRVLWALDVSHYTRAEDPQTKPDTERWVDIELSDILWTAGDWRKLANLEIRSDAAWFAGQEHFDEYGSLILPQLCVYQTLLKSYTERTGISEGRTSWIAHDFILRFGNRDGWSFPCELDAWLIPATEYYRTTPETPAELKRRPTGPPNLRLITRATFEHASLNLTRAEGAAPEIAAQNILREQLRCEPLPDPEVKWIKRHTPDRGKIEEMPGWRSTVSFYITP